MTPWQAALIAAEREQESLPETPGWRTGFDLAVNGAAAKLNAAHLVRLADANMAELMAAVGRPLPSGDTLHSLEAARGFADGCLVVAKRQGLT